MTRDHNLLFGVFAVQLGKVTPVQLMDTAAAWAADQSRDIPSRLVALGILAEPDRDLLQRFVDEAVAAHGGNAERTLANFGGEAQVHRSFRGSIVLSADGMVSIPPTQQTPAAGRSDSDLDAGSVKGVFETPGRYTELREYARGGMGRVLLVHDDSLGREIALKELLPHLGETEHQSTLDAAADPDGMHPSPVRFSAHILARFLQEARITGQLEHPSIVPVYELGHRRDGSLYYTMKLVRGRSLSKALKECKNLEERLRYLPHFVDLCQAIAYAHSRKIIHRDIKPANVMVGEFGETVVLDWGLAKKKDRQDVHEGEIAETIHAMNLGDDLAAAKTGYGQILGTPVYMAPEQARGDLAEVDEQSDVYALGVVLYEILTGKVPFDGKSTGEVLKKVIAGERLPVEAVEKDAPPELAAIAYKAMRREKAGRYGDVKALAEEALRFQSGALVKAHRYNLAGYTRFVWRRYKPLIVSAAASILLLLAVTGVYLNWLAQSNRALVVARDEAIVAREEAVKAKERESDALGKARETIVELEHSTYVANIRLAQGHVERGEANLARERLLAAPESYRNWEWGYLRGAMDTSIATLKGHTDAIRTVAFSPDGTRIVTASNDATAIVWSVGTGEIIFTLEGHKADVWGAQYTAAGDRIVTSSSDGITKVWDAYSGGEMISLPDKSHDSQIVKPSPDGTRVFNTLPGGSVEVWSTETGERLYSLVGHTLPIIGMIFSLDGGRVGTLSEDETAKVWDARTGDLVSTLPLESIQVGNVVFSPDGTKAAITSRTGGDYVSVWKGGVILSTLGKNSMNAESASFSPDGEHLVTGSWDNTARVWDVDSGKELLSLNGHSQPVKLTAYSPDGTCIVTTASDSDNTVKVWDAHSGKILHTLRGHGDEITHLASNQHGTRLATASVDGTVKVWDIDSTGTLVSESSDSAI